MPTRPWLPKLNLALAPRLRELLKPDSIAQDSDSAEYHVRAVLEDACQARASDIHLEPCNGEWRVRLRIDGRLHDAAQVPAEIGMRMMRFIRTAATLDPVVSFKPQDASFRFTLMDRTLDLRLASVLCVGGEKQAIRILDPRQVQHRIEHLGLRPPDLELLKASLDEVGGMFLVTGPAGCGKTTTLYALIHELELSSHAVVTIEDPVEYPVVGISQIQVNAAHGLTFAAALKSMLRLDPDYLLVGEIRDGESAQIAIEAAATGHCLLSTLHSPDTAGVVTFLRNWNIHDHQIASALQITINQRLVRRLCPKCRKRGAPSKIESLWLKSMELDAPGEVWQPVGCKECQNTGYQQRLGVFEVWQKDDSDYELILAHADEQTLRRHQRTHGVQSVLEDGLARVREGVTTLGEIRTMGVNHGHIAPKQPTG